MLNPSTLIEGDLTKEQLIRLVICQASQNQRLAQMKQEKLTQIEGMLKWTRRIALTTATGLVTYLIPQILKILGVF